jgi:hypothetical protein
VPSAQAAQSRSPAAVAAVDTKVPAGHVRHGEQAPRFGCAENVPLSHATHDRFAVAEPAASTRSPGAQLAHGTHPVAAMPSWSQVPWGQLAFGAEPPGHEVPASHGRQSLAGAPSRRAVPGAHGSGGAAAGGGPTAGGVMALQPDTSTSASAARHRGDAAGAAEGRRGEPRR